MRFNVDVVDAFFVDVRNCFGNADGNVVSFGLGKSKATTTVSEFTVLHRVVVDEIGARVRDTKAVTSADHSHILFVLEDFDDVGVVEASKCVKFIFKRILVYWPSRKKHLDNSFGVDAEKRGPVSSLGDKAANLVRPDFCDKRHLSTVLRGCGLRFHFS